MSRHEHKALYKYKAYYSIDIDICNLKVLKALLLDLFMSLLCGLSPPVAEGNANPSDRAPKCHQKSSQSLRKREGDPRYI